VDLANAFKDFLVRYGNKILARSHLSFANNLKNLYRVVSVNLFHLIFNLIYDLLFAFCWLLFAI